MKITETALSGAQVINIKRHKDERSLFMRSRDIRWSDPAFDFHWPLAQRIRSLQNRNFPDYNE